MPRRTGVVLIVAAMIGCAFAPVTLGQVQVAAPATGAWVTAGLDALEQFKRLLYPYQLQAHA